jgi:DNA-binding transcriptional MocR family regulator
MVQDSQLTTRTEQVTLMIRQQIERRVLTPGARLPSVRAMAESSGFSKSTVVEAYDRLVADGTIRSRPGSGFFVSAPLAPLALADITPRQDRQIDPMWMLRQSLQPAADALMPGCGWLPEDWIAGEALGRALRAVAREAPAKHMQGYSVPAGYEPLRTLIARRLVEQGVEAGPDQLLITDSGTHSIDLVLRFLIEPGDAVMIDDPSYFNFQALLRAHRAVVIGVPMTPTGPDPLAIAALAAEHRPRLYITNSAVQNPTGASLSAPLAHRILKTAEAHDIVIVEDDIFADFEDQPSPRYAAFDGLDRVIRVGSFSKSLSSTVRLGYIAARPDWMAGITDLRIATAISGSMLSARLVTKALTDGSYRRHMDRLRAKLARRRQEVEIRLAELGVTPWVRPAAGMFLWGKLPNNVDAAEVARRGLEAGVVFAPGNVFSVGRSWGSYMRFNVAMMAEERIFEVLARAIHGPGC